MYKTKLTSRKEVADGTAAFYLEKPLDFEFKAGQFVEMALLNPLYRQIMWGMNPAETDSEGNTRAFSIASAPYEPELMITMRMRDTAFKRVLETLPAGTEVRIEGPFGDFTLHPPLMHKWGIHNNIIRPAVFLIGGIGITPVRSIVVEAAQEKLPHKIFLFYSNRWPKDAAFLRELRELEIKNPNYKFIPTMTGLGEPGSENATASAEGGSNTAGSRISATWERGYINEQMLKKYLDGLQGPIYYSAGPQAMVAAMRKMLNDAGIDDDDIRTEEFPGY